MRAQGETNAARNLCRLAAYQDDRLGPRAEVIRGLKATYLKTGRDDRFGEQLEACLLALAMHTATGLRDEAAGIVLLAETGAGKSRLIRRNVAKHKLFQGFLQEGVECPGIGVRCLQAYTLRVLATEILATSGYPVTTLRENRAWVEVRDRLQHLGVLLLWIDEVNNLLTSANRPELKRILNSFKAILNHPQWPVVLVLSGTPECEAYLRRSSELCRRMRWSTLDPMEPADLPVLAGHVAGLCAKAGLEVPDGVVDWTAPRLSHAAGAQFGVSVDLAIEAIGIALVTGRSTIEQEHFATAYARRTQARADANPFVAPAWEVTVPLPMTDAGSEDGAGLVADAARGSRARLGLA